jgi:hypothetical protein
MKVRALLIVALVLPVIGAVVASSIALAGGQDELTPLRNAIAPYHDIAAAKAAGYVTELPQTAAFGGGTCIANGSQGAMGIHQLDTRVGGRLDATLDPVNPEALLYERRNDGTLKLTGVEYIVAEHTATGTPVPRPSLYGQQFADTNLARFGDAATNVWTLHAWVFKPNPGGMFDPWNTRVSC